VLAKGGYTEAHFIGQVPAFTYTARFDSATENAAKYILVPDDPHMDVDAYATIQVTLHEPEDGIETALLWTLEQLLKTGTSIATDTEGRCF
jgi:hypothetical protein